MVEDYFSLDPRSSRGRGRLKAEPAPPLDRGVDRQGDKLFLN